MTDISEEYPEARISRTIRYRKETKPLLERRRRARINRCLEELKDLMVGASEVERENINKLEKADILELTVRHLSKHKGPKDMKAEAERFQAGFGHCAAEAYNFILSTPGVDQSLIQQMVKHLSTQLNERSPVPVQPPIVSPAPSMSSVSSGHSTHSPPHHMDYHRATPSVSPPVDHAKYQHSWKENTPSVPIEKTLTCDVSNHNTHSMVRNPGDPNTGLLMTVNDARRLANNYVPEMTPNHHIKNYPVEHRERPALPPHVVDQERKNVILKKIREHIMERQSREPDSTTSVRRESKESVKYNKSPYDNSTSPQENDLSSFRRPGSYESCDRVEHQKQNQPATEEAINLTNNPKHVEPEAVEEKQCVSSSEDVSRKRKQTDYKNIHPKKFLIRAPNHFSKPSEEIRDVEVERKSQEHCDDMKGQLMREGFQRYKNHYFNLEKEEYYRTPHDMQDQDQDDMWRPW